MKFIFKDPQTNTELALPVTPRSFELSSGIRVETVNIHALGDVLIGGYTTLGTLKIPCMFPGQQYPFASASGEDPYTYVKRFAKYCENRTILRFVITETPVNIPVLLSDIQYGEKDGSGDVYVTITMREYRFVALTQSQKPEWTGNESRAVEASPPPTMDPYTIVRGDTLSAICRKFYGEAALYPALAKHNGIKNPNLIYTGNQLRIPEKSLLKGA